MTSVERCPVNANVNSSFLCLLYKITLFRCIIKWIVRLFTGTCELQRIIKNSSGGIRTLRLEQCMMKSKSLFLPEIIQSEPEKIDHAISKIMTLKNIVPEKNPRFAIEVKSCLNQIYGYNSLYQTVEEIRMKKYDSTNKTHEQMLFKLWNLLQPNEILQGRVSKQWGNIGFQGNDPQTDFRGMGVLGLQNLLYFAEMHTDVARQVLQHSHHPQYGYSYAIVGINITSMAYDFLASGLLRTHFYNNITIRPKLDDFHQVYCYLFFEFDKLWMKSEPENVMAFGRIRDEFQLSIHAVLKFAQSASLKFQKPSKLNE